MRLAFTSTESPILAILVTLLCGKQVNALVNCGEPGRAMFAANGQALYFAVRCCYSAITSCTDSTIPSEARGSKAKPGLLWRLHE